MSKILRSEACEPSCSESYLSPLSSNRRALSLVEILVAIGLVATLALLARPFAAELQARAFTAACASNLRGLHTGFSAYLQDKLHWPQQPGDEDSPEFLDEDWWIAEMRPYGIEERTWQCPAILRYGQSAEGDFPKIHYAPSFFDTRPFAPFEYPKQPWFLEIASVHPKGPHVCFPDGSVRAMDDILAEKGQN